MLPAISQVLVPVDLGQAQPRAVAYAYSVVAPGGTVHLVHAIEPVRAPNPLYAHYSPGHAPSPEERRRQHEEIEARLRALIPPEAAARGVVTRVHVEAPESVSEAIVGLAERLGADLVCLDAPWRRLAPAHLGPIVRHVLSACPRPTLLIR